MTVEKTLQDFSLAPLKRNQGRDTNAHSTNSSSNEPGKEDETAPLYAKPPHPQLGKQKLTIFSPSTRQEPLRQPSVPPAVDDLRSGRAHNFNWSPAL